MKRRVSPRLVWIVALTVVGCGGGETDTPTDPGTPSVTTVTLSPAALTLDALGATATLTATARGADGRAVAGAVLTWSSSDPTVATVSATGRVTATGNGSAVVTAAGGPSATATVEVRQQAATVRVTGTIPELFGPGDQAQLQAAPVDRLGTELRTPVTIAWSTSDPTVADVDASGRVTAHMDGTTTITATASEVTGETEVRVVLDVTGTIAIVGAEVLPMNSPAVLSDHAVVVVDGVITAVGPTASVVVPQGATVVDAAGRRLVPGLTDAHTHIEDIPEFLPYVANGITTVFGLGNWDGAPMLEWREQSRRGEILAPNIYTSGKFLDGVSPRPRATIVTTPAEGRAAVQAQVAAGVDFIKVYNDLRLDVFDAIMDEARSLGVAVLGHGVRAPGLQGLLDAGQIGIAHGEEIFYTHFQSNIDPSRIPSAVQAMADAGAWVMPNLSTFAAVAAQWGNPSQMDAWLASPEARYLIPGRDRNWQIIHDQTYRNRTGSVQPLLGFLKQLTTALHQGGVDLLLSTDSPIIPGLFPGFSIHDDLDLLVEVGLTPYEALRVGTSNGGRFIREHVDLSDRFGEIQVGWRGDLILTPGDPAADIGVLRHPDGVMVRGRYLSGSRLDQLMEQLARDNGN